MKFTWPLHKSVKHSSLIYNESLSVPGVRYAVRTVSLSQRIELTKSARDLCSKYEFLKAGDTGDQLEASLADLLIRRLYLEWGLAKIDGLKIDGSPATLDSLIEKGPEPLTDEIIGSIKAELGLTEDERKNF
jgi:hypothetical protein